jgi:hypothetical protein
MLKLWKWMAAALVVMTLVACGGGGGGSAPDTGGGTAVDLYAAYDEIGPGMSYDQVRDIVGHAHNNGQIDASDRIRYDWIAHKNTVNVTIMYVEITRGGGVIGKVVGGPKGNFSRSY